MLANGISVDEQKDECDGQEGLFVAVQRSDYMQHTRSKQKTYC